MSLKAVHLFFVGAFSGTAFLCAVWKFRDYLAPHGSLGDLLFAAGSVCAGIGIIIYGRHFLKKLKHISYL